MNKKGFTLIELLIVLAIVSIASAGSILIFDRADTESDKKELKKTYVRIQRAAKIYLDMNDSWRKQFIEKKYIYLKINELQNENFLEHDLLNPEDLNAIDPSNLIYIYLVEDATNNEVIKVDSCIVDSGINCVANADGDKCACCIYSNPAITGQKQCSTAADYVEEAW